MFGFVLFFFFFEKASFHQNLTESINPDILNTASSPQFWKSIFPAWVPYTLQVVYYIHSCGFKFQFMLKVHRSSLASCLAFYCVVQYLPTVFESNIVGYAGIDDGDFSLTFKILTPCACHNEFNHLSACVILSPAACSCLLPDLSNLP